MRDQPYWQWRTAEHWRIRGGTTAAARDIQDRDVDASICLINGIHEDLQETHDRDGSGVGADSEWRRPIAIIDGKGDDRVAAGDGCIGGDPEGIGRSRQHNERIGIGAENILPAERN